jgi:hypothetical protein
MLHPDVRRYGSPVQGRGLVAARFIAKDTVVCSLGDGDQHLPVTHRQLRSLPKKFHHLAYRYRDHYVLCFDDSQYMNHSCDPNLWWMNDDTLVAMRDIQSGEEVTYDYATSEVHVWWRPKWKCNCGAARCRTLISGRDCLDPAFRERYRDHLPSWVRDFIAENTGLRKVVREILAALAEGVRALKRALRGPDAEPIERFRPNPSDPADRST